MALIDCPDCKKEVSSLADKCPHCARPIMRKTDQTDPGLYIPSHQRTKSTSSGGGLGALVAVAGLLGFIYFLLIFDTSVAVPAREFMGQRVGGGRVHNLGLMQERNIWLAVTGVVTALGVLWHYVARRGTKRP